MLEILPGVHHWTAVRETIGVPVSSYQVEPEAAARLEGVIEFDPYRQGEQIAPAVTGREIGRLAADEGALHLAIGGGAVVFADALNHYGDTLGFFPDSLLGDDPPAVKRALTGALSGLLAEYDFDHRLFAHGAPIVGGARAALRAFVERQQDEP